MLGAYESRAHRDRWLVQHSPLAASETHARIRTDNFDRAVAALDNGRALTLSEQLEARTRAARHAPRVTAISPSARTYLLTEYAQHKARIGASELG